MGNASSSEHDAPAVAPSEEQVDRMFTALADAYTKQTVDDGLGNIDQGLMLHRLRMKLHQSLDPGNRSATVRAFTPPRIATSVADCIHETPLVQICPGSSASAQVVAKLEYVSPGASVKDRTALQMILDAEQRGIIRPGTTTIVDLTSGNTGIGLGVVCASRGYRCVQILPDMYSVERRAVMMALGVHVILTPKAAGITGLLQKYFEVLKSLGDDAWSPRQFDNPANIAAHFQHTGPEIWEQCDGKVDVVVAAYGTGGTLSGIAEFLRTKNPKLMVITVDPTERSLLNGDPPAPHGIQGIAPSFVPDNLKVELLQQVVRVSTSDALDAARNLAKSHGILCGISSGANVHAALQVASRPEMIGKRIVTVLPSGAERYLSTPLYADLMEEARGLETSAIDESIVVEGVNLNNRETLDQAGRLRPDFQVI
jgi:cysteine synthase